MQPCPPLVLVSVLLIVPGDVCWVLMPFTPLGVGEGFCAPESGLKALGEHPGLPGEPAQPPAPWLIASCFSYRETKDPLCAQIPVVALISLCVIALGRRLESSENSPWNFISAEVSSTSSFPHRSRDCFSLLALTHVPLDEYAPSVVSSSVEVAEFCIVTVQHQLPIPSL